MLTSIDALIEPTLPVGAEHSNQNGNNNINDQLAALMAEVAALNQTVTTQNQAMTTQIGEITTTLDGMVGQVGELYIDFVTRYNSKCFQDNALCNEDFKTVWWPRTGNGRILQDLPNTLGELNGITLHRLNEVILAYDLCMHRQSRIDKLAILKIYLKIP
jgi:hypothetical protein